jgi:hypothetical protein
MRHLEMDMEVFLLEFWVLVFQKKSLEVFMLAPRIISAGVGLLQYE